MEMKESETMNAYREAVDNVLEYVAKKTKVPIYYLSPVVDSERFTYDGMYLRAISA